MSTATIVLELVRAREGDRTRRRIEPVVDAADDVVDEEAVEEESVEEEQN